MRTASGSFNPPVAIRTDVSGVVGRPLGLLLGRICLVELGASIVILTLLMIVNPVMLEAVDLVTMLTSEIVLKVFLTFATFAELTEAAGWIQAPMKVRFLGQN